MTDKKLPPATREQLEEEYTQFSPLATTFCTEVSRQLERLLGDANVTLGFPIEFRVKSWPSIQEKFERVSLPLATLTDLNDFVGLRIVLLFRRDVELTCRAIKDYFEIVNSYDTLERLREDQFGYGSRHFIVKLPQAWLALPTFAHLGSFKAEIQVRTIAQHIWAAASHNLQYKQEQNVPVPVRRSIFRVSALLETVDLELERVLHEREAYRAALAATPVKEIVEAEELPLNVDLLQRILDSELPPENKGAKEDYGELLKHLAESGVHTTGQLQALISRHRDKVLAEEAKQVRSMQRVLEKGKKLSGTSEDRVRKGVFYLHVGLARRMLTIEISRLRPQNAPNASE